MIRLTGAQVPHHHEDIVSVPLMAVSVDSLFDYGIVHLSLGKITIVNINIVYDVL